MRFLRLPMRDPRTVARDIPGICDVLFPRLLPGLVGLLNQKAHYFSGLTSVSAESMMSINVNAAMIFEVAFARAEQMVDGKEENMEECLKLAQHRQSRYFDASPPTDLTELELSIIRHTSDNLIYGLSRFADQNGLVLSPEIPGFEWIATGNGDFAYSNTLIEVKCTAKGFSSNDYRQLLIYWLLSFASSIEKDTLEWKTGILFNPRLNNYVEFEFDELIYLVTGGTSKVEVLELFRSMVSEYTSKLSLDSLRSFES